MGATETGFVPKASERRNRDLRVGFQLFPIRPGQALGFVPEAAPDTLGDNIEDGALADDDPTMRLLLTKVIPVDNILFATEMIGAVRGIDPETGHYYDDTKRYVDQLKTLGDADRCKIFEGNARRVYPRLDKRLKERGHAPRTVAA